MWSLRSAGAFNCWCNRWHRGNRSDDSCYAALARFPSRPKSDIRRSPARSPSVCFLTAGCTLRDLSLLTHTGFGAALALTGATRPL